ncbi:MAG TPA: DinB family protein [Candidatus Saccharimonadales bacterium]|jgi:uncharacterized damage-inducible protein DinB|nr:DinB family protein [Candidatus Saccharimonadales bacterium]
MPGLSPEHALFIRQLTLPLTRVEHATTKRVIEAIPLDKGDFRPDPVAKTALELAWHIVAAEHRFLNGIFAGAFDFTAINRPDSVNNSAAIAKWFDDSFTTSIAKIEGLSGADLVKTIDFRGLFQLPAVSYLGLTANHTIHHRGQLSMYLRPMGAKVPSIYGESYDAAQERIAKEKK